jgi:hypothetical protein
MLMKSSSMIERGRQSPRDVIERGSQSPRDMTADAPAVVIILKKTQGSVWSEAGRTPLCPTQGWLRENYGAGQYELRLKRGNRILCMISVDCAAVSESRISDNERVRAGIVLRGTALG